MAWGKSIPEAPPSVIRQIVPLVITFLFIGGATWVCYQIYLSYTQIKGNVKQRMDNKNVVFTKKGVRVGAKHIENEKYVDVMQNLAVKAWNLRSEMTDKDMISSKSEKKSK